LYIIDLPEVDDASSAGAKAANLGCLLRHGFDVPAGFVITSQALALFLEESGLGPQVDEVLTGQGRYEDLLAAVHDQPLPAMWTDAVVPSAEAMLRDSSCGLAVRSSGSHEDSSSASFAGVYESILGVCSVDELWSAVKTCWGSSWAPGALAYSRRMGVEPEAHSMAVIVQRLLPADSAGVLFTADPQTGNPWRFVAESTFGLAQDLVGGGGTVPADRYVLAWDTGELLEQDTTQKSSALRAGPSGIAQQELPTRQQAEPSLTPLQATQLSQMGLAIDRLLGCRVDIEWVVVDGEISVVQARPLTALPAFFPYHLPAEKGRYTWRPVPLWPFVFWELGGQIMPPLYRDLSLVEKDNRYHRYAFELEAGGYQGEELDLNGYRYIARKGNATQWSLEEKEQYLGRCEADLRREWLETKLKRYPALRAQAEALQSGTQTLSEQIAALLWARDTQFDVYAVSCGPAGLLGGLCQALWNDFTAQHLADFPLHRLLQGCHDDLHPYFPHVQLPAEQQETARVRYAAAAQDQQLAHTEACDHLTRVAPDQLPRFARRLDWVRFWGSAKNDRGWGVGLQPLWSTLCDALVGAGLIDMPTDIGYFTAQDLGYIAATGDVTEGRRILARRQLEYEGYARLQPPEMLGRSPEQHAAPRPEELVAEDRADDGATIRGTGLVHGTGRGRARKIDSLEEAPTVSDGEVLLFATELNATSGYSPVLLSLMLRVCGMVTMKGRTNTNHIAQIARECGVPIVQIAPEDMARIDNGAELLVDGAKGSVRLVSAEDA
jgi:phosphohistidine swiveling domain-containing protein